MPRATLDVCRGLPFTCRCMCVPLPSSPPQCIIALFCAKLAFPNHVHLARGNHETKNMNKMYGFEGG